MKRQFQKERCERQEECVSKLVNGPSIRLLKACQSLIKRKSVKESILSNFTFCTLKAASKLPIKKYFHKSYVDIVKPLQFFYGRDLSSPIKMIEMAKITTFKQAILPILNNKINIKLKMYEIQIIKINDNNKHD